MGGAGEAVAMCVMIFYDGGILCTAVIRVSTLFCAWHSASLSLSHSTIAACPVYHRLCSSRESRTVTLHQTERQQTARKFT